MTKHINDPTDFPELELKQLQQQAKRWVKKYPALNFEQILLHLQRLGQADTEQKLLSHLKYVLVFEISNCQHVDLSNIDTYPTSDDDQCVRSLKEIKYMDQFANQRVGQNWHRLFDPRFPMAVYKQPPGKDFPKEWSSVLKRPDEKLDRFVDDEPFWVLYPSESVSVEEHEAQSDRHEFYQEGPSWTIIYEENVLRGVLRGLIGKGFEDIHFLVKNEGKIYHINEIIKETEKVSPDFLSQANENFPKQSDDYKISKKSTDHRDLADSKFINELKEKRISLLKAVQEAEKNDDIPRLEKAKTELEEFNKHCAEYFGKNGKARKVVDETTKSKNRVNRRIERALKEIKKYDENTFNHFHTAIKKTGNNYFLQYNPVRHIDWITEKK